MLMAEPALPVCGSLAAAAAFLVPRWSPYLCLPAAFSRFASYRTARPGRSGHYRIRFTSVEIQEPGKSSRDR